MAYERVNWENLPSTKTPINQTNLNKMENGIDQAGAEIFVGAEEPTNGEKVWFRKDKNSIYVRNSNGMYEEFIEKKIKYGSVKNPDSSKFQITYSRIVQVDNTVYVDILIKILTEIPADHQYDFTISGVTPPESAIYPLASYGVNEYNFRASIYCYVGKGPCVLNNPAMNSAADGFWKVHFSYNVD